MLASFGFAGRFSRRNPNAGLEPATLSDPLKSVTTAPGEGRCPPVRRKNFCDPMGGNEQGANLPPFAGLAVVGRAFAVGARYSSRTAGSCHPGRQACDAELNLV